MPAAAAAQECEAVKSAEAEEASAASATPCAAEAAAAAPPSAAVEDMPAPSPARPAAEPNSVAAAPAGTPAPAAAAQLLEGTPATAGGSHAAAPAPSPGVLQASGRASNFAQPLFRTVSHPLTTCQPCPCRESRATISAPPASTTHGRQQTGPAGMKPTSRTIVPPRLLPTAAPRCGRAAPLGLQQQRACLLGRTYSNQ